jgi:hypothetical protein
MAQHKIKLSGKNFVRTPATLLHMPVPTQPPCQNVRDRLNDLKTGKINFQPVRSRNFNCRSCPDSRQVIARMLQRKQCDLAENMLTTAAQT